MKVKYAAIGKITGKAKCWQDQGVGWGWGWGGWWCLEVVAFARCFFSTLYPYFVLFVEGVGGIVKNEPATRY